MSERSRQRFFKYTCAETAEKILRNKCLRWKAPELFNDPFEFKNPFEFGFDWEDLESPLLDEMTRLVTQPETPQLLEDGPTTSQIISDRLAYASSRYRPSDVRRGYEGAVAAIIERLKREDAGYDQIWRDLKRQYRVICFCAVLDNILMWSHYADEHKGVVLAFEPQAEKRSELATAKAISYSKQVNTAASLEDFVAFLTSQRPKPDNEKAFEKSAFRKSVDWAYEQEWRVFTKDTTPNAELYMDRPFDPAELVSIYFGCRANQESKDKIIEIAKNLGTPISFFEMRDERIRFELTPVRLQI